ncbi:hypothetical protein [Marinobacter gelidimuriae]|uniref:hypothetical protein n=1 Tax=Marinobacter gelidimuriae TaxID=2739064 RepID=UPI0003A3D12D|nr:hypothetical protein [Marinobacter gelidimuriae]
MGLGSLILSASALATFFLFNPDHTITLPLYTDLLAVIVAGVYVCATALFSHQQAKALRQATSLIQTQREQSIALSQIALKHGGTIDKFMGDSIMIFFGDPTSRGQRADTLACVSMAIDMRKHMKPFH